MRFRAFRFVLAIAFVVACDQGSASHREPEAAPTARVALVRHDAWAPTLDDPFEAHQPELIDCAADGRAPEGLGYEVDTGLCNYLLVAQPTAAPIRAGDVIEVAAFHGSLQAPEPAVGHVALAIGDTIVWDTEVAIPSDAAPFGIRTTADHDIPVGTPVVFHLHNHGVNTWTLVDIRVHPYSEDN